jgi:hypothetical protein
MFKNLAGVLDENKGLGRPKYRWEDKIRVILEAPQSVVWGGGCGVGLSRSG